MWNPVKIYKLSKKIMARGYKDTLQHYDESDDTANEIVELYGEMLFPFVFYTGWKVRRTEAGRNILNGVRDKSEEYQLKHYIPKMVDGEYLDSLAPNTVGAHYKHLIDKWSFEELYNERFQAMPKDNFIQRRRANFSRHIFLSHDFWHCIFRYDTSPLGEACIQAITHQYSKFIGPWYMSYLIAYKHFKLTASWDAFKVIREAHKIGAAAKRDLYEMNFDTLLEMDIEEVRAMYNVQAPTEFYRFAKDWPENFKFDCIHPEYNDTKITYTEATI